MILIDKVVSLELNILRNDNQGRMKEAQNKIALIDISICRKSL